MFIQRTGGKPDGCAIFYRHAKFTLVKSRLVQYFTAEVQVLDKDNVGIVVLLKANTADDDEKDAFICVANTHLLFNKKRGDIKLAQLAYLFAEINELSLLSHDDQGKTRCPVILCGDLNSLPHSPLYRLLTTGQLQYNAISASLVSGQLTPSQAKRGPSARRMSTPLLPWEFGVTAKCQWRGGKSESSFAHTQDKRTFSLRGSSGPTRNVQDLKRHTERKRDADKCNDLPHSCESKGSTATDPHGNETSVNFVNSVSFSSLPRSRRGNEQRSEDWATAGKSGRNSKCIDLTRDTGSSSPLNRARERNRVGISGGGDRGPNKSIASGDSSKTGKQHSDMPTASSGRADLQSEKTNHNNNGTISIPWLLHSVYTHRSGDENPEVTTCHSKACCNVDYIFYTAGVGGWKTTEHREYTQEGKLTLLGRLQLMRKSDFNTMSLLPNHIFPSDHLSLQARFLLTT